MTARTSTPTTFMMLISSLLALQSTHAFMVAPSQHSTKSSLRMSTPTPESSGKIGSNEYLQNISAKNPNLGADPKVNPDRPELPEIPGDYDWDAKFSGDSDWITGPEVPGKKVLSDLELAQQAAVLDQLEETWRKQRLQQEYEGDQKVGFVSSAEIINGRTAMFFLITGLLTEYWTGVSMPGQVEEMLRVGGFIGFD